MSAEAVLSSAIEVSIGIAGFAGIVAAIRQREIATWQPGRVAPGRSRR